MTSRFWQYRAKHLTPLSVNWRQPLLRKLRNSLQPLAKASTPLSVSNSHHDRLMWVRNKQPSERSFSERSVISGQESRFNRWSFRQCVLRAAQVVSEIFLHWLRLSSSMLGQDSANACMDMSSILWHPLRDNCLRNPPQRLEMLRITDSCTRGLSCTRNLSKFQSL